MRYKEPSLGASKAIYKGKRYWVIELAESSEIGGFGTDECQYVMYDKLYDSVLACSSVLAELADNSTHVTFSPANEILEILRYVNKSTNP